jgi:hypothetical protein
MIVLRTLFHVLREQRITKFAWIIFSTINNKNCVKKCKCVFHSSAVIFEVFKGAIS